MGTPTDHRSAPRRRGEELVDAILSAACQELIEVGYAKLSYESVARRSGASKVSIYRRWPTKPELVKSAAAHHAQIPQLPGEPSTLQADLRSVLGAVARQIDAPIGQLLRALMAASVAEQAPSMAELSWGMGPGLMRKVAEQAVARGELSDVPEGLVLSVPTDLIKQRFISYGTVNQEFIDDLVQLIVLPLWLGDKSSR